MENTGELLTEQVKKSELSAVGIYDFCRLQTAGTHFLPMEWGETEEEVTFKYAAEDLIPFIKARNEDTVTLLNLLIQAADFEQDTKSYQFSIEPSNLYYDSTGVLYIKSRDLPSREQKKEGFLLAYKALIACALNGQYSFRDYMEGGEELLKKNPRTAPLFEAEDAAAAARYLKDIKGNYLEKQKREKISVSKTGNRILKLAVVVLTVSTILLGIYSGIQYVKTIPYLTAVNSADNAYIENDNVALIDSLKGIQVGELDKHQKYTLAKAYLQSESLSSEQKENILARFSLDSNPKELEYWIYLGRLNVTKAEDLAMQLTDDELLLYAYLKDKSQTQADTSITGTEKEQKLRELQSKIDSLEKKYNLDAEAEASD
ncbi:type VII secretion protein EssB/YukC [Muricomes intestini]|uniref:Type VII secretion protein EssB n=1 Tax=Muricomes intestini TaxID=1796634 RepID=A0A4R3K3K4_9FIRM|nr:type VII secretion protein EssB/YukC [Muricomes intestini]TCS77299.1 type VII secretion protein EssB [Muricomes intestini]